MEQKTSLETLVENIFGTIYYYRDTLGKVRQAKLLSLKVEQYAKACPIEESLYGCRQWDKFEVSYLVAGYKEPQKITANVQHDCRSDYHYRVPNMYKDIQCQYAQVDVQEILDDFIKHTMVQTGIHQYLAIRLYDTFKYYTIEGDTITTKSKFVRGFYVDANANMHITFCDVPERNQPWSVMDESKKSYPVSATSAEMNKRVFKEFTKTSEDVKREFEENNLITFDGGEHNEPTFDADTIRANVLQILGGNLGGVKVSGKITINGIIVAL